MDGHLPVPRACIAMNGLLSTHLRNEATGPAAKMQRDGFHLESATRSWGLLGSLTGQGGHPERFCGRVGSPGTVSISHSNPVSLAVGTIKLFCIKRSHTIPKVWRAFRKVNNIVSLDTNSDLATLLMVLLCISYLDSLWGAVLSLTLSSSR